MNFKELQNGLEIRINKEEKKELSELIKEDDFHSDRVMIDFFEKILSNCEFEWGTPEEIGALTEAPVLVTRDENDKPIVGYAYMDYQVKSLLQTLYEQGKAFLCRGL